MLQTNYSDVEGLFFHCFPQTLECRNKRNLKFHRDNGDVVLGSVTMAFRDEDNILDQIYVKQIFLCFIVKI